MALGAAVFNAKVAAAAHQVLGPVSFAEDTNGVPLQATLQFRDGTDPNLAGLYELDAGAGSQPPLRNTPSATR